jgi:predicted transcriptional regulator
LCAKKLTINYDIDLDIRILNAIVFEKGESITISNLRNYIEIHSTRLEQHLEQLAKWNMIVDTKPDGPGKARIISFGDRPSGECMIELVKIKEAIDKVNEYFDEK